MPPSTLPQRRHPHGPRPPPRPRRGLAAVSPPTSRVALQSTPAATVTAFYKACNDGSYSTVERLASKESIDLKGGVKENGEESLIKTPAGWRLQVSG